MPVAGRAFPTWRMHLLEQGDAANNSALSASAEKNWAARMV